MTKEFVEEVLAARGFKDISNETKNIGASTAGIFHAYKWSSSPVLTCINIVGTISANKLWNLLVVFTGPYT